MRALLDLSGCLGDSPAFRKDVNVSEDSIAQLDSSIKNLMKIAKNSMDIATEYSSKNIVFAQELTDFAGFSESKEDPEIEHALSKFGDTLKELERSRTMMISHMSDVFIDPIENFAKDEINPVKECKRKFDQASDCYDSALSRYLSKKPKDVTIPESAKEVEVARKDFLEKYLEHTIRLNELHSKKKCEFMEYVLAMMYTQFAFFHQGYELLRDLEPFMRDLTSELQTSRTQFQSQISLIKSSKGRILKEVESTLNPLTSCPKPRDSGACVKSGYLLKRGSGRMVQPWSKRHFSIEGELLVYSTRGKDEEPTVAINLRVCTVKPADNVDRRFCFEVISPQRTFLLQAESEEEASEWIRCLINATKAAIQKPSLNSPIGFPQHAFPRDLKSPSRLVDTGIKTEADPAQLFKVRTMPGNEVCAECKGKDAVWASINLGIALCIECSGIHRSLGVHYSKVRSLTLDKWESEIIEVMLRLGNDRVNQIFESSLTPEERQEKRPSPTSDRNEKLKWITAKYVKKEYVEKASDLPEGETVDTNFWRAINQSDLCSALRYLALGANVNYRNEQRNFTSPLHQAILASDNVSVEFLFQWGSDVNAVDADGWSSLHHAAATNNLRLVLHLLKRHAKLGIKDRLGKTPVDVATDQEHVQVVTTLRMFQFEQQEEIANAGRPGSFGYSDTLSSRNDIPPGRSSINLPPSEGGLDFLESDVIKLDRPTPRRKSLDGALRPKDTDANTPNNVNGSGTIGAAGFAAATATRFAANFKMPQFSRLHDMNAFPANPFATSPTSPSEPVMYTKSHTAPSSPLEHPGSKWNS